MGVPIWRSLPGAEQRDTYQKEVDYMKNWLEAHLAWMDEQLDSVTTGVVESENPQTIVQNFSLHQNYPNPFNPSTHIQFDIASQVKIRLNVYDILGREVATLVNKEMMPGKYNLVFDANDLPSGIYFYKIQAGKYSQTNKMILLK